MFFIGAAAKSLLLVTLTYLLDGSRLEGMTAGILTTYILTLTLPLLAHNLEYPLFARRAVLLQGFKTDSQTLKALWNGSLTKVVAVVLSAISAWILILFTHELQRPYWYVMYGLAIALPFCEALLTRILRSETNSLHTGMYARRLLNLLTIIAVAAIVTYISYSVVEQKDLRGAPYLDSIYRSYELTSSSFSNAPLGVLVGVAEAAHTSGWYLMQTITSTLPDNSARLTIWMLFLVPIAIQATVIVGFYLGASSITEIIFRRIRNGVTQRKRSKTLLYLTAALGVLTVTTWLFLSSAQDLAPLDENGTPTSIRKPASDCQCLDAAISEESENYEEVRTISQSIYSLIDQSKPAPGIFQRTLGPLLVDYYFVAKDEKTNTDSEQIFKAYKESVDAYISEFEKNANDIAQSVWSEHKLASLWTTPILQTQALCGEQSYKDQRMELLERSTKLLRQHIEQEDELHSVKQRQDGILDTRNKLKLYEGVVYSGLIRIYRSAVVEATRRAMLSMLPSVSASNSDACESSHSDGS